MFNHAKRLLLKPQVLLKLLQVLLILPVEQLDHVADLRLRDTLA